MRVVSNSAIEISESLCGYLLGSYIYNIQDNNCIFEKRLNHVRTNRFSIADIYYRTKDTAIEIKGKAHGNSALKGVVQASVYKEQVDNAVFCMQKPRRSSLVEGIESFASRHGVGVIWITGVPLMLKSKTIKSATGGNEKPFEIWKNQTFSSTRETIIERSNSDVISEFLNTLDVFTMQRRDDIFDFSVKPNAQIPGFCEMY